MYGRKNNDSLGLRAWYGPRYRHERSFLEEADLRSSARLELLGASPGDGLGLGVLPAPRLLDHPDPVVQDVGHAAPQELPVTCRTQRESIIQKTYQLQ